MFLFFLLLFLILPQPTYAYLDPGTGSYLIQILIAAFVGSSYFIASSWSKIKFFLRKTLLKNNTSQTTGNNKTVPDRSSFKSKPSFLNEFFNVWYFFKSLPKNDKRIVFYSEHKGYWPYFEGLINYLTKTKKQTICYITSQKTDPVLQTKNKRIKVLYLNKLLPFFMVYVDCKVFVMTLTDLNQLHLKRSMKPVHYVYVFHSLVSTHMMYRQGAFDYYDSLLCVGPRQIEEITKYEKMHKLKKKELVKAGYYRLERIYNAHKNYSKNSKQQKQKTILIAPSWGEKNILQVVGTRLIDKLLTSNYKVICRPHPETLKRTPELIKDIETKFVKKPNFVLEKTIETDTSLLEADVLITDASGIALEYAFGTERPVLFIDVPPKIKNPKFKELKLEPIELLLRPKLGKVIPTKQVNKINEEIKQLILKQNQYKKNIISLRKKYVFSFGRSSEKGGNYIVKLLKK